MARNIPVKGLAELDRFLSLLPKRIETGAYRAALTAAAAPVRDRARENAAKRSGKMARAIRTGSPRKNRDGTFSVRVSLKGPHAFLGLFQEYGVARHLIARTGPGEGRVAIRKAKEGKGKVQNGVMKIGGDFVSGIIEHPGHGAHAFLRPALDAMAEEALVAFRARLMSYLEGKVPVSISLDEAV